MQGNLEGEVNIAGRDELGGLLCEAQSLCAFLRTMVDEIGVPITKSPDWWTTTPNRPRMPSWLQSHWRSL